MHLSYNTNPNDYIINLTDKIRDNEVYGRTASNRVVYALQLTRPEIETRGFRRKVLEAIFDDGVSSEFYDDKYRERLLTRLYRCWGKAKTKRILLQRCDVLWAWKYRDSHFIPDAYLIDQENKTIVCYEVEDTHPLNPFSVGEYAAAWWTLEYIGWDLHLIAYDIYGNPRIVAFPEADFMSSKIRRVKMSIPNDGF
jgi:hypothetical protein